MKANRTACRCRNFVPKPTMRVALVSLLLVAVAGSASAENPLSPEEGAFTDGPAGL